MSILLLRRRVGERNGGMKWRMFGLWTERQKRMENELKEKKPKQTLRKSSIKDMRRGEKVIPLLLRMKRVRLYKPFHHHKNTILEWRPRSLDKLPLTRLVAWKMMSR